MRVYLKNIGLINSADISLNGITVIAGENDSSKSTISKTLFSIIKSLSKDNDNKIVNTSKRKRIEKVLDEMYFNKRGDVKEEKEFKKLFALRHFLRNRVESNLISFMENDYNNDDLNIKLEELYKQTSSYLGRSSFKEDEKWNIAIIELFDELKKIMSRKYNRKEIFNYKLLKYIDSLFENEINNKFINEVAEITVHEGNLQVLDVKIKNNRIDESNFLDELYIKDATLVESPIILQLSNVIYNARTNFDYDFDMSLDYNDRNVNFVSLHIKDLINKLVQPNKQEIGDDQVYQIINGNLEFDEKDNCFVYKKGNKKFRAVNIASGIKSFGILQMLLQKGFLEERNLLILDEPEVNLHPKWQVAFAKLLVKIVKKNKLKVILTSHSPYFIEAIKVYSDICSFEKQVSFYMCERIIESDLIDVKDVTDNLEKIFDKLAEPFDDLEIAGVKQDYDN